MAEVSSAPFSRNTTGRPSTQRLKLGRCKVWYSELDDNDAPTGGWIDLGEMPTVNAKVTKQLLDYISSMSGARNRTAQIPIDESFGLDLVGHEMSEDLAAAFLSATPAAYTNAAIAGFAARDIATEITLGRSYELSDGTNRAFGIDASDLTVVSKGATQVTAAGGRTLTFAQATKKITASSGSFITDGYKVGHPLEVNGTMDNDGNFTIAVVTALEITVVEALVDEGPLSATATLDSADVALVEDTDFVVDEKGGELFLLSTATNLLAGDTLRVTLAANASAETMRKIEVHSRSTFEIAMKVYGEDGRKDGTGTGQRYLLYIPKGELSPNGDLPLVSAQEVMAMPLTFAALKKDASTPIATLYALPPGGVT